MDNNGFVHVLTSAMTPPLNRTALAQLQEDHARFYSDLQAFNITGELEDKSCESQSSFTAHAPRISRASS